MPGLLNEIMFKFTVSHTYHSSIRYLTSNAAKKWKSVIGLEVHAQILSETKLFSPSSSLFLSPINENVSLHDASIPGTLPVLNKRCVEAGVKTALALDCKLSIVSMFDRKHYFYGDMPAGYQITQQRNPLAKDGNMSFFVFTPGIHKNPYAKSVKIKQLQLEQDSGKSLHGDDRSLIDLNRAGVGLMEVVFEPDLSDGEEAAALLKELIGILRRIETCSCKMEEGALRVDANVSIHRKGEPLGVRTEIKNIGSVRGVASAIKYEIQRQIQLKEEGHEIINETRSWDANSKSTVGMRDKEEKQDYRYMPEPNLPPLHLSMGIVKQGSVNVDELKNTIPELPAQTRERLQTDFGLTVDQSIILVNDDVLLKYFEDSRELFNVDMKLLANILIHEFITVANKANIEVENFLHRTDFVAETVNLLQQRKINRNTVKHLFGKLFENNPKSPHEIVTESDLFQITDEDQLVKLCEEVLKENEKLVSLFKNGKTKVFKSFMGKIASRTNQRADMAKCDEILRKLLSK